jgi:hypothetical protein
MAYTIRYRLDIVGSKGRVLARTPELVIARRCAPALLPLCGSSARAGRRVVPDVSRKVFSSERVEVHVHDP